MIRPLSVKDRGIFCKWGMQRITAAALIHFFKGGKSKFLLGRDAAPNPHVTFEIKVIIYAAYHRRTTPPLSRREIIKDSALRPGRRWPTAPYFWEPKVTPFRAIAPGRLGSFSGRKSCQKTPFDAPCRWAKRRLHTTRSATRLQLSLGVQTVSTNILSSVCFQQSLVGYFGSLREPVSIKSTLCSMKLSI